MLVKILLFPKFLRPIGIPLDLIRYYIGAKSKFPGPAAKDC